MKAFIKIFSNILLIIIIILCFLFFVNKFTTNTNISLLEGNRNRRGSGTGSGVNYKALENKIDSNTKEIKKIKEKLDDFGDVDKRISRLEKKTRKMPNRS